MTWTLHEMTKAIHEAQLLAIGARERVYIIEQGSRLKATTRPLPTDKILVNEIVPPCENWDAKKVAQEALEEFPDARPALERMLDIIDKDNKGRRRAPTFKAEAFAALISYFTSSDCSDLALEQRKQLDNGGMIFGYVAKEPKTLWQNICATFRA